MDSHLQDNLDKPPQRVKCIGMHTKKRDNAVIKPHLNLNIIESRSALVISIVSYALVKSNHISGRTHRKSCYGLLFKWWLLDLYSHIQQQIYACVHGHCTCINRMSTMTFMNVHNFFKMYSTCLYITRLIKIIRIGVRRYSKVGGQTEAS